MICIDMVRYCYLPRFGRHQICGVAYLQNQYHRTLDIYMGACVVSSSYSITSSFFFYGSTSSSTIVILLAPQAGQTSQTFRRIFPSCIFIQLDIIPESWQTVAIYIYIYISAQSCGTLCLHPCISHSLYAVQILIVHSFFFYDSTSWVSKQEESVTCEIEGILGFGV